MKTIWAVVKYTVPDGWYETKKAAVEGALKGCYAMYNPRTGSGKSWYEYRFTLIEWKEGTHINDGPHQTVTVITDSKGNPISVPRIEK